MQPWTVLLPLHYELVDLASPPAERPLGRTRRVVAVIGHIRGKSVKAGPPCRLCGTSCAEQPWRLSDVHSKRDLSLPRSPRPKCQSFGCVSTSTRGTSSRAGNGTPPQACRPSIAIRKPVFTDLLLPQPPITLQSTALDDNVAPVMSGRKPPCTAYGRIAEAITPLRSSASLPLYIRRLRSAVTRTCGSGRPRAAPCRCLYSVQLHPGRSCRVELLLIAYGGFIEDADGVSHSAFLSLSRCGVLIR